jgi:CheY-like chemotaxis protein
MRAVEHFFNPSKGSRLPPRRVGGRLSRFDTRGLELREMPCDVLIVEDDFDIREVLADVLEEEGYSVAEAANGYEALELLRRTESRPRLILLDLMMPVMSGWQFVAEQRQDGELSGIPVVIVSADGNLQQKAASLGANGYIRKPIEIEHLLDQVHLYCRADEKLPL